MAKRYRMDTKLEFIRKHKFPTPALKIWSDTITLGRWQKTWIWTAGVEANFLYGEGLWITGFHKYAIASILVGLAQLLPIPGSDGWIIAKILRENNVS